MPEDTKTAMAIAGIIVALMFAAPLLGIASYSVSAPLEEFAETSQPRFTQSAHNINEPGFQSGSIFTNVALSTGFYHTCAIVDNSSDTSLQCWGSQNGIGVSLGSSTPAPVSLPSGKSPVYVSSGDGYTCVINNLGEVECIGSNSQGQSSHNWSQIAPLNTAVSISSGVHHTCAILDNASMWCWGDNSLGELGFGTTTGTNEPAAFVNLPAGKTAVAAATGNGFTCSIMHDGSAYCWGGNALGQIGDGTTTNRNSPSLVDLPGGGPASALDAGGSHACALLENGSLWCWGENTYGQLGDGTDCPDFSTNNGCNGNNGKNSPSQVLLPAGRTAISISAANRHTCAILDNGSAMCWGQGGSGVLGAGLITGWGHKQSTPVYVDLPAGQNATSIDVFSTHACATLEGNSSVMCWGYNGNGQLGDGSTVDKNSPSHVALSPGAYVTMSDRDIDGDGTLNIFDTHMPGGQEGLIGVGNTVSHEMDATCVIMDDGSVVCTGGNSRGQLGDGTLNDSSYPVSVNLPQGRSAVDVTTANWMACALLDNGSVSCWGSNWYLNNETNFTYGLETMEFPGNQTAVALASGSHHHCAILENRSVSCWGWDSYNQLGGPGSYGQGLGSGPNSRVGNSTPVSTALPPGRTAVAISAGDLHTCIVLDDGSVVCHGNVAGNNWGSGNYWSVSIPDGREALSIASGRDHACAILDDRTLHCWGSNSSGQANPSIVFPQGQYPVSISAGQSVNCAIVDSGSAYCWGYGGFGSLGDGNGADSSTPVEVSIPSDRSATSISAGGNAVCATLDNGSVMCWGIYNSGQFGNGLSSNQSYLYAYVPVYMTLADTAETGDFDPDGDGTVAILDRFLENPARSILCPAGYYGRHICESPLEGHYAAGGLTHQDECSPGTYQPSSGQASCIESSPGHYVIGSAATSQFACDVGTYNPLMGQAGSIVSTSTTNNSTNTSVTTTAPYSSSCLDASPGHYVDSAGAHFQTPCPLGTHNPSTGSNASSACIDNSPGSYSYGNSTLNNSFESGTMGDMLDNWTWNLNSSYVAGGGGECIDPWNVSSESPIDGIFSLSAGGGDPCNSAIAAIGLSHYSHNNATFEFSYRVSTEANWDHLIFCWSDGPHALLNNSLCPSTATYWAHGTNFSDTTPNNSPYSYHYFLLNGMNNGTVSISIPQGYNNFTWYYWKDSSFSCSTSVPSIGCEDQVWIDNIRVSTTLGAAIQAQCSPGTYQPSSGQASCLDSSPGHYASGHGSANQTQCSPGTYQPSSGQASCLDASPGYYVPSYGSVNQTIASPGHYVDSYGSSNETACPGGTFNPYFGATSSTYCIIVSAGYYSDSGSSSQTPCSPGTYQPSSGQASCFEASPGHHVPSYSSTVQTPCSPGFYQPYSGAGSCFTAEPGYYAASYGLANQTACPAGTYNPLNGSSSSSDCIDASPGHHAPYQGMSEQYECGPGAYQPLSGQSNCTNADPGYFVSSNQSTSQEPCEVGTYQPDSGRSSCLNSSPGYYVPHAASYNQTAADPGHYANSNDTTSQYPCSPGTYQPNQGRSECYEADTGSYVENMAATNQTACPRGTYNQMRGSDSISACIAASPGYFASETGMSIPIACDYGTFQPLSGQTECLEADPGHFVDNNGSSTQSPCEPGTYNPDSGEIFASSCIPADPGHFSSEAAASQEQCGPGTYQPSSGQASCIEASTGYFVDSTGATMQTIADIDHYVDSTGSTSQTQCPVQHMTIHEGMASIGDCLIDHDSDRSPDRDDEDDDNDGVLDQNDFCSTGATGWLSGVVEDSDGDGCRDSDEDTDDDNDDRLDAVDDFPLDPAEQDDTDGDGQGDNADLDDDNDGLSDALEYDIGTDRLTADTDGDGYSDKDDAFPLDTLEWMDTDGDGTGDNSDVMKTLSRYQTQDQILLDAGLAALALLAFNGLRNRGDGDEEE